MQKILVAVDGSSVSNRVVSFAAGLKKTNNQAHITLISVSCVSLNPPNQSLVDPDFTEECNQQAQRAIDQAVEVLAQEGVTPDETFKVYGDPAVVITDFAKKGSYNLIIMGSRGLSDIKGFLLGSVSHKVLHLAECPVTIVK